MLHYHYHQYFPSVPAWPPPDKLVCLDKDRAWHLVVALLWFNFYCGDLICWLLKENILMNIGSGIVLVTPSMLSTALNPQQALLELTLRGPTKFAPKVALWQVTTNVPLNQFNNATSTIVTHLLMRKTREFSLIPHFLGLTYICVEKIPRGIQVRSISQSWGGCPARMALSNHLHATGVTIYVSYID